jgi:hypothetical protein
MTITIGLLLLGAALADAILRQHERQNETLRAAFADIEARRQRR